MRRKIPKNSLHILPPFTVRQSRILKYFQVLPPVRARQKELPGFPERPIVHPRVAILRSASGLRQMHSTRFCFSFTFPAPWRPLWRVRPAALQHTSSSVLSHPAAASGAYKRIVVTRQDDRATIPQQRLNQCLVVAIAQLVLVASGLARSSDVGRVAVREPVRAVEPLEAVAPVAAFDLNLLYPIVYNGQVFKARTPAPGRACCYSRSPGISEQSAKALLDDEIPPHRLLDRIMDRRPGCAGIPRTTRANTAAPLLEP